MGWTVEEKENGGQKKKSAEGLWPRLEAMENVRLAMIDQLRRRNRGYLMTPKRSGCNNRSISKKNRRRLKFESPVYVKLTLK